MQSSKASPRVLLFGTFVPFGGVETHVTILAKALCSRGATVTVFSLSSDFFTDRRKLFEAVGIECLATNRDSKSSLRSRQFAGIATLMTMLRRRFDTICAFGPGGYWILLRHNLAQNGKLYFKDAGWGAGTTASPVPTQKLTLRYADAVLCNAPSVAQRLITTYGLVTPPNVAATLALPEMELPKLAEHTEESKTRRLHIAFCGRLTEDKNVDVVLRLWSRLKIGPAQLHIFGGGPCEEELRKLDAACHVEAIFHGRYFLEELPGFLPMLDMIVLPSRSEGLGQVLIQGMAWGIPFDATCNGGPADIAANDPDLACANPEDPDQLARAIEAVAARIRSGQVAPKRLQDRFVREFSHNALITHWANGLLNHDWTNTSQ
jgi:glycosyltransferase involved in cell wall biosynthesis